MESNAAFFRREPRLPARGYLLGLMSGLERKNAWTLAEFAGDGTPDGMQRLLNAARWDQDAVRDSLGRYVAARAGDPSAVLIADETGFEKTGMCSPGRSPTARSRCSWPKRSRAAACRCW